MGVAVIKRAPVPGGSLTGFDGAEAQGSPGVRAVLKACCRVAVVADDTRSVMNVRDKLTTR